MRTAASIVYIAQVSKSNRRTGIPRTTKFVGLGMNRRLPLHAKSVTGTSFEDLVSELIVDLKYMVVKGYSQMSPLIKGM